METPILTDAIARRLVQQHKSAAERYVVACALALLQVQSIETLELRFGTDFVDMVKLV